MTDENFVSASEIDALLREHYQSSLVGSGFEAITPRKWVRTGFEYSRQIVSIQLYKGGSYRPTWGISLDFVPHMSGTQVRWHRTPKSALYDFLHDPGDHLQYPPFQIPTYKGIEFAMEATRLGAPIAIKSALAFFGTYPRLEAIAEEIAQRRTKQSFGLPFDWYPQEWLALAFILGRLERSEEAREELEGFIGRYSVNESIAVKLRGLISASK